MLKTLIGLLIFVLFAGPAVHASPAQVIIIRHGEKPASGPDLNERGHQRALALVGFFTTNPKMMQHGRPAQIFAMQPKNAYDTSKDIGSMRAIETVQPLADYLHMPIDADYITDDYKLMADKIMKDSKLDGKMVLICWEHKAIPPMADYFGATQAPNHWDKDVFDRAWVINFDSKGKVTSFEDLPQDLLPGDSTN
jgi:broad specificity phosphatase PhoE